MKSPEHKEQIECPHCGSTRLIASPIMDRERRTKRCQDCGEIMTFDVFIGQLKTEGGIVERNEKARAKHKIKPLIEKECIVCDESFMTDTDRETCGDICINILKRINRQNLIFGSKGGKERVQKHKLKQQQEKKKVKKMKGLTMRQREVLDFIRDFIHHNEYPPSYREIGSYLRISSTKGITDHLAVLVKKGYIRHIPETARAIILTDKAKELYANEIPE